MSHSMSLYLLIGLGRSIALTWHAQSTKCNVFPHPKSFILISFNFHKKKFTMAAVETAPHDHDWTSPRSPPQEESS